MKSGRYASKVEAIPAPETPTARSRTGSQQQLDAISAETTVPILAINSPRLEVVSETAFVAPGNGCAFVLQQLPTGSVCSSGSLDIR